ncbi:MAG TPA: trehalase-like domain-containing protein, partial [Nocardioidaceae bacterium]
MSPLIESYALVGNTRTAALIGRDGSVDWLCLPRFDAGACFAGLLGGPEHGRWLLAPAEPSTVVRRYVQDTMVLETEFETATGRVVVVDFMPLGGEGDDLVRIVRGVAGRVDMRMELVLRFEYGSIVPWVEREGTRVHAIAGPDAVCLDTPV